MTSPLQVPFASLVAPGSGDHTFAYWLGTCRTSQLSLDGLRAHGLTMASHYDFDEQYHDDQPTQFQPTAPIQLVSRWSPFATALELLGAPMLEDAHREGKTHLAAVWSADQLLRAPKPKQFTGADQRRFSGLVRVTLERAKAQNLGLWLVGSPGFSVDTLHSFSPSTRALMVKAQFIVQDRRL